MPDEVIQLPPMRLADGRTLTWTGTISPAEPGPGPQPPGPPTPPPTTRSGLPWVSGVFANDPTMPARFSAMRGRPVDLADVHCEPEDVANPYWIEDRGYTPATVGGFMLSLPLTPEQTPDQYRAAGRILAERGFTGARARLRAGVEFNLKNRSAATDGNWQGWAARFRAAARAFRDGAGHDAHVVLCVNEGDGAGLISWGNLEQLADQLLRDRTADELGVDFYDQWPPSLTPAAFAARIAASRRGSIGWWADFAAARGAKISIPEWGVARNDGGQWEGHAGGDNPVFITGMVDWFRANAARLGHEAYFAEPEPKSDPYIGSDLTTQMPRARAAYAAALAGIR